MGRRRGRRIKRDAGAHRRRARARRLASGSVRVVHVDQTDEALRLRHGCSRKSQGERVAAIHPFSGAGRRAIIEAHIDEDFPWSVWVRGRPLTGLNVEILNRPQMQTAFLLDGPPAMAVRDAEY